MYTDKDYLEISVHDTLFVHVIYGFQHLTDQMGGVFFGVRTFLYDAVEQLASSDPANGETTLFDACKKLEQHRCTLLKYAIDQHKRCKFGNDKSESYKIYALFNLTYGVINAIM